MRIVNTFFFHFSFSVFAHFVRASSQFTLHASTKKGNRPSFLAAADPVLAKDYYQKFGELIKASKIHLQTGVFGADMQIELVNDGPVTMCLDSKNKE